MKRASRIFLAFFVIASFAMAAPLITAVSVTPAGQAVLSASQPGSGFFWTAPTVPESVGPKALGVIRSNWDAGVNQSITFDPNNDYFTFLITTNAPGSGSLVGKLSGTVTYVGGIATGQVFLNFASPVAIGGYSYSGINTEVDLTGWFKPTNVGVGLSGVPEPATVVFVGLGLSAISLATRRRSI